MGFSDTSVGKESACNAGDPSLIPGLGRSAGKGIGHPLQYPWASLMSQVVKNLPAMQETWVQSLGWEDPLEKGKATHSSILDWRIPWNCIVHGVATSWTLLSDLKKKEYHTNGIRWYLSLCMIWPLPRSIMNVRVIIVKSTSCSFLLLCISPLCSQNNLFILLPVHGLASSWLHFYILTASTGSNSLSLHRVLSYSLTSTFI